MAASPTVRGVDRFDQNAGGDQLDQQVYAQNYRPYVNNRRPSYPAYVGNNRRPPSNSINNNRPATSSNRPVGSSASSCSSPDAATQQGGICWDSANQLLRTAPSLTNDQLVAFYSKNFGSSLARAPRFRSQICEQSRRFNSVGVLCVSTGEEDCELNGASSAQSCINYDCICVVGGRCQQIAQANMGSFYSSNFPAWMLPYIYNYQQYL